jgi:hypothetical protein
MNLFELVKRLILEVEREKGNLPKKEELVERVQNILVHSVVKHDHNGLSISSWNSIGVKNGEEYGIYHLRFLMIIEYGSLEHILNYTT